MRNQFVLPIILLAGIILSFFSPVFFFQKVPIPVDNLVYQFHPFRDYYVAEYARGVPYKNALIGDPVTQMIPWKSLAMDVLKRGELPHWNPYAMAGYPLLSNIQSSPFYFLNIFLLLPFIWGWSTFIILQQVLAGIFMYLYLKNKSVTTEASFFGGFIFAFCGFTISWLEWGTIIHTALWLPLILLCIDKLAISNGIFNFQFSIFNLNRKVWWAVLYVFSLSSSLFAGHLQTFIYLFLTQGVYFLCHYFPKKKQLTLFGGLTLLFMIMTSIQWVPSLQFILLSGRGIDQSWHQVGWFIPWENLIQFIVPNFFGNPSTGNYWGTWNYGEFIGYIGIIPFLFVITSLLYKRDKETRFFAILVIISLLLALPTWIGKLPFLLNIPLLSSTQPTRLLFLVDFALCILAAYGLDHFIKEKKRLFLPVILTCLFLLLGYAVCFFALQFGVVTQEQWMIALRNSAYSVGFLGVGGLLLIVKQRKYIAPLIIGLTIIDLFLFAYKYTPFPESRFFFPTTKTIAYLQEHAGSNRIMSTDRSIMHPNIPTYYHLQSIDGYDPLYLLRYGELMAAMGRRKPDISPPFGFTRIITPNAFYERIVALMGTKYLLSVTERGEPYLKLRFQEGETRVYENTNAYPRAFFVSQTIPAKDKDESISFMFNPSINLRETAVVEGISSPLPASTIMDTATITTYTENTVIIKTKTSSDGFMILTDNFYPGWKAFVDNKEVMIYRSDYTFRGVSVPKGEHTVVFSI